MKESSMLLAAEAFKIESESLASIFNNIDKKAFAATVGALCRAERIAASGCGHSGIACMHFAHLMCCIERPARFISPAEAMHGGMGFVQKGDAVLLASRGGKTSELLPILEISREKGAFIICVTENLSSPLAFGADATIKMTVGRETDKYDVQGTTSFVVLSSIFDALQCAVIEETGHRPGAFALVHPGGAVGERLNKRSV